MPEDTTFELPPIAEEYVSKHLDIMPTGKACWLDGIAKTAILKPVTHVFNVFIRSDTVLEKARIIPVHKSCDRGYVNSYRPVSILPVCSNTLEIFVQYHLFSEQLP